MDTLIFHKADRLPSLSSTWTVQKSFYKTQPWYTLAMAHNLIKAVDERPHFNINTIAHCASLSRNCTATERSKNVASSCSTVWIRITMPTESILESPKLHSDSIFGTCSSGPNGVHFGEIPLYVHSVQCVHTIQDSCLQWFWINWGITAAFVYFLKVHWWMELYLVFPVYLAGWPTVLVFRNLMVYILLSHRMSWWLRYAWPSWKLASHAYQAVYTPPRISLTLEPPWQGFWVFLQPTSQQMLKLQGKANGSIYVGQECIRAGG